MSTVTRHSCWDCGARTSLSEARRNCVRCGFEYARSRGLDIYTAEDFHGGDVRFEEMWQDVVRHLAMGWIAERSFYLYVSFGDGRLGLHPDDVAGRYATADEAELVGARAAARYDQVWVVTDHGAWRIPAR